MVAKQGQIQEHEPKLKTWRLNMEEKTFDVGAVAAGLRGMKDFVKSFHQVEDMFNFVNNFEATTKEKSETVTVAFTKNRG